MGLGRSRSVALIGLTGSVVEVEASQSSGLPSFVVIGLPDAALSESKHRVTSAASNSGSKVGQAKLTVNLSPAALPKHGSGFDLAIAVACLAALGEVDGESVARVVHLGELGLDGRLRPSLGILPSVLAAARAGLDVVMVPRANEAEARLVEGVRVVGVGSLAEAAIWHGANWPAPDAVADGGEAAERSTGSDGSGEGAEPPSGVLELADVVGNEEAVSAMVAAAAGGHHVFLLGPPGAGKTMLADRLPGILPDLAGEEALEATCMRSLTGRPIGGRLVTRPPFESPHHTASAVAIVGGGSGRIRPGAIARASRGVLFLDEAPEFPASVLDALRQPLESGLIRIHRSAAVAEFPARFQLVLAANPCPCGRFGIPDETCTCPPQARRRYLARMSGPLLDRVDIRLSVRRVGAAQLRLADTKRRLTTADARWRVERARARAAARLEGTGWRLNAEVPGSWLRDGANRLPAAATQQLDLALERGLITMRGYDRILRLAWTLADLEAVDSPTPNHLARALVLRGGDGS